MQKSVRMPKEIQIWMWKGHEISYTAKLANCYAV